MFEGFRLETVELSEASICVRHGGCGRPVLLIHGHPRTHVTWHRVAAILASSHTVVCPDLPGFGRSSQPPDTPDHRHSSKRTKARVFVELMHRLGFETFAVVGHDRGAYTAFRMALDYPALVTHLGVLDAVPISEALSRCDSRFAEAWWHWFFYAQPEKPEQAINRDPLFWYGGSPESMGADVYQDFVAAICNPSVVHGMLEDYRAGLGIDRNDEVADREAGRMVQCPTLALWSLKDDLENMYGDVLAVWRPWTKTLQGRGLISGHHMAEEIPEELANELRNFLNVREGSDLKSTD